MARRVWLSDEELESVSAPELRRMVARHQRIFNASSGYGFWDWNMATNEFDWSGEFWQKLGYGEDDAPFISNSERMAELIHPDDLDATRQALVEHLKTGKLFDRSYRVRAKDGEYRWTQCLCDSVRNDNGRVTFLSGINFDISSFKETEAAMRQSEERQQRIIEGANDGIWEWSFVDQAFFFSRRIFDMVGVPITDEELKDGSKAFLKFRSLVAPEDLEAYDSRIRKHIKTKEPYDNVFRVIGGGGKQYWIRSRGQATFDENGMATLFSGTNSDITDRKIAEEKAIRAKEIAEKANQAKSEFLSRMSHELRTPLNAILGFSQLFEFDKNLNPRQQQNIGEIRKAGEHLLQLINDILDLAKIESGKLTLSLEPVLPMRIVDECVGLVQSIADSRNIRLQVSTCNLEGVYVHADAVRLKQVLLNLMSNGIKYNCDGGSLSIVFSSQSTDKLTIKVQDSGHGIPEDMQKYVFEPFNRLGREDSETEGSGVGLVITKQLVEVMGGSIHFVSEEDKGTCFEITFNRAEEWTAEKARTHVHGVIQETTKLAFQHSRKIVYIEDNASNLRLMEQLLGRFEQIQLKAIDETFRGLYHARTSKPDLIILDINLPGMDGFEALKVLKQDPNTRDIPVIALSANAMTHDVKRGMQAGFDAYLTKPVVYGELIGTLNKLLREEAVA